VWASVIVKSAMDRQTAVVKVAEVVTMVAHRRPAASMLETKDVRYVIVVFCLLVRTLLKSHHITTSRFYIFTNIKRVTFFF